MILKKLKIYANMPKKKKIKNIPLNQLQDKCEQIDLEFKLLN